MLEFFGESGSVTILDDDTLFIDQTFMNERFAFSDIEEVQFKEPKILWNGNIKIKSAASGQKYEVVFNMQQRDDFATLYLLLCEEMRYAAGTETEAVFGDDGEPNCYIFNRGKIKVTLDGSIIRIARAGIINELLGLNNTKSINISQVASVSLQEPDGVLKGFILFSLTGGAMEAHESKILFVDNELEKAWEVKKYIEKSLSNPVASTGPTGQADSAEEIRKYKKLLDDGIITQEEFDAKKSQLLGI